MWSRRTAFISLVVGVSLGFLVTGVQAQIIGPVNPPAATGAGNLEPPSSAVNGSGQPTASSPTHPSWDQRLTAGNGGANGCNSTRFKCIWPSGLKPGGVAVLDKNTGLVWEQSPQTTSHTWNSARGECIKRVVGGQMGWRLPSVHELASLMDTSNSNPALPTDHPFLIVPSAPYWSASSSAQNTGDAWLVVSGDGSVGAFNKANDDRLAWCVRGGGPLSEY